LDTTPGGSVSLELGGRVLVREDAAAPRMRESAQDSGTETAFPSTAAGTGALFAGDGDRQ